MYDKLRGCWRGPQKDSVKDTSEEEIQQAVKDITGKESPDIIEIHPDRLRDEALSEGGLILSEPAGHYNSSQGYLYEPCEEFDVAVIYVLHDLWGAPWDATAENYLRCLRPSKVRVIGYRQGAEIDRVLWRVTIRLDIESNIDVIEQEVEVGTHGFQNGLDASLHLSINRLQVERNRR